MGLEVGARVGAGVATTAVPVAAAPAIMAARVARSGVGVGVGDGSAGLSARNHTPSTESIAMTGMMKVSVTLLTEGKARVRRRRAAMGPCRLGFQRPAASTAGSGCRARTQ